jgi:hypothetical protein
LQPYLELTDLLLLASGASHFDGFSGGGNRIIEPASGCVGYGEGVQVRWHPIFRELTGSLRQTYGS